MERYAGIDVSLERSSICVVDGTGKIVRETKVPSEPEALIEFFARLGLPMTRIGLEAGRSRSGSTPDRPGRGSRSCCWRPAR